MNLPKGDVADGGFSPCWAPWIERLRRPIVADIPRVLVRCPRGHVHAVLAPVTTALEVACPVRTCVWTGSVSLVGYTPPAEPVDPTTLGLAGDRPSLPFNPPYSVEQLASMGYVAP